MRWLWHLAQRSNDQAVANARTATTTLSRRRVQRDAVDLYLVQRYADPSAPAEDRPAEGAR